MSLSIPLHQFNGFTAEEKLYILDLHGTYLETYRMEGCYKVALFSIFNYYVELWHNLSTDELENAKAFISYKRLDAFLNEINIAPAFAF
jgi:hypothetical protein